MNETMDAKRVLHIVSAMDRGGAETLIMNIYKNLDRKKVQFDFITHNTKKGDYDEEILSLGGRIFNTLSLGTLGPVKYMKELVRIMTLNHYEAVHSHTDYQSGFPALAAKISGIKRRICHSHSTNWPKGTQMKEKVTLKLLKSIIKFSATSYCSCSMEAAQFLFGKNMVDNHKVKILKNGIDLKDYEYVDQNSRYRVQKELSLPEDTKIIGHVGRFSESKNQIFILRILKEILAEDERFVALFIGDGPLKREIEQEAERLGILHHVKFLGVRTDIPRLMKSFDVFLFPSIFEGFGIVTLEAQCAGTPCVVADTVPKTTDLGLNLLSYVSLNDGLNIWVKKTKQACFLERPDSTKINEQFKTYGYDIRGSINDWLRLYGIPS
jgi:glycosyltransferase EpsF